MTCGNGNKTRRRLCNNPSPLAGGADCPGLGTQQAPCFEARCPVSKFYFYYTFADINLQFVVFFKIGPTPASFCLF